MFFWTPAIQNPEWCVSSGKNKTGMDDYFKAWVTHDTYHEAAGDTFFHNVMYLHTWLKSKGYNAYSYYESNNDLKKVLDMISHAHGG